MIQWNRFPLLRIVIPWIAGITPAVSLDASFKIPWPVFIALSAFIGAWALFLYKKSSYSQRWIFGLAIMLFFGLASYNWTVLCNDRNNNSSFGEYVETSKYFIVRLIEPIQVRENSCKAIIEVEAADSSGHWKTTTGKAIIYFPKDSISGTLRYGDRLLLSGQFASINAPANPYEFDYRKYCALKGIYYQTFIKSNYRILPGHAKKNPLFAFAFFLQKRILNIFEKNGLSGKEYAVAAALLVGYKDKLDADLMKDYSGTGAMHILSVSGMHVGIIFVFLNFVLSFMSRNNIARIVRAILLLVFVWLYALLTGLSPSVLRSAAMISFIIIAGTFRQKPEIFNTLAASALLLLIIDPFYLADIGFQLSYIAVAGIVSVYPKIYKLWKPRYKLTDKVWSLIAVSIAAQLATFPLCLYYFGQFPNYFLLTNLIAIPISTIIIYAGIVVLALSFINPLAVILGKILSWSVWSLNSVIHTIEGLPGSSTRGVYINAAEVFLFYFLLLLIPFAVALKNRKWMLGSIGILVILLLSFSYRHYLHLSQQEYFVYSVKKNTALEVFSGHRSILISDSSLAADSRKQAFHINNNREHKGISTSVTIPRNSDYSDFSMQFIKKGNIIWFAGKSFALADGKTISSLKIRVDYLVLVDKHADNLEELQEQYDFSEIIIAGSYPTGLAGEMTIKCKEAGFPCHNVITEGAYKSGS